MNIESFRVETETPGHLKHGKLHEVLSAPP